jgi:hypothetical protein
MVLGMARPQRHRRTGVYLFRRRVPQRLQAVVGKTEEVRSLGTKDPTVARARFAAIAAEVDERWKNLARGPAALTHEQVLALAGELYSDEVAAHQADPGDTRVGAAGGQPDGHRLATAWSLPETLARDYHGARVDALLARRGLLVSEGDRKRLVLATVDAMKDAHAQLRRNAEGDYGPDPQATRFPPPRRLGPPLTVAALWADYKEQKQPSLGTIKRWEPILTKMAAFVGVADVRDLTEDDLIRWRDHLLQAGGSAPRWSGTSTSPP